jgi:hypothetical protein
VARLAERRRNHRRRAGGAALKLEQIRPNVVTLRATSQELSALVAAARTALDFVRELMLKLPALELEEAQLLLSAPLTGIRT